MNLLGKAMDPAFWQEVRTKKCFEGYRNELLNTWNERCEGKTIPELSYNSFIRYEKDGNRSVYEGEYFGRRMALGCAAILSLIYPDEEKYFNYLEDILFAVCNEYTWCLHAHQGNMDFINSIKIDLFASETGFALAEIYTMLEKRLEPLIKRRILFEIDRRIMDPMMATERYGNWEGGISNWTAVCMGSIGCTVMLVRPDLFEVMKSRFMSSMESYLRGLHDDGICIEGVGYWHYGFGFFVVFADMVRTFTNGEIDYFSREKVKIIAMFMQKMYLSGKASVSYADGNRETEFHLGLVHYLKKEYPDCVKAFSPKFSYYHDNCERFCLHLRYATWLCEEYYDNPDENSEFESYAPQSEWLTKKTKYYGFSVKGGRNDEMHNHNDVGSFIFAKNGRQMLVDFGAGTYTQKYFSTRRYEIIQCNSYGHSVPIVNGKDQFFGGRASAADSKFENGVFETDIAGAYEVPELKKLGRKFEFKENEVTLTETYEFDGECRITERFVSCVPGKTVGNKVIIDEAELEFDPNVVTPKLQELETEDDNRCYAVDFEIPKGILQVTFKIR